MPDNRLDARSRIIAKEEIRVADAAEVGLRDIGWLQLPPRSVADVEHFNLLLFLNDAIYHAINMRLVAVKQVPQHVFLARYWAAIRLLFQTENCLFNPQIPFHGRIRILGVDLLVQAGKVALRMGGGVNDVCHASLQTRRKTLSLAVSFPLAHPPNPGGYLPLRRRGPQGRAGADRLWRPARWPPLSRSR